MRVIQILFTLLVLVCTVDYLSGSFLFVNEMDPCKALACIITAVFTITLMDKKNG